MSIGTAEWSGRLVRHHRGWSRGWRVRYHRPPFLGSSRTLADLLIERSQLVGHFVFPESVELIGLQVETQGDGEQIIGDIGDHDARQGVVVGPDRRKHRPW